MPKRVFKRRLKAGLILCLRKGLNLSLIKSLIPIFSQDLKSPEEIFIQNGQKNLLTKPKSFCIIIV